MHHTKQEIVDMLRKAGLTEEADKASEELSDPVEHEDLEKWAFDNGITRDALISQFGGSP